MGGQSGDSLIRNSVSSGVTTGNLASNCMRGTPDGQFLTFFTDSRLVSDDPDATTGDIYAFDAQTNELLRVSAPQGGDGEAYICVQDLDGDTNLGDSAWCHGDQGIGGGGVKGLGRPRLAVADVAGVKAVFFQSRSRLVPEDVDDQYDVYAWRNGVLSLVSEGTEQGAYYAGNSSDGEDVFFLTRDRLSWQDVDSVMDVYDARDGGGILQPPSPVVCEVLANECQGPAIGVPTTTQIGSDTGGGGNASPGVRKKLTVARLSAKARRKAARTGSFVVSVRISKAGKVSAVARGRVGKRTQRVASKSVRVRKAGKARLKLRLNRAARQRLESGRSLNLSIQVRSPGARPRSMSVRLPGASS